MVGRVGLVIAMNYKGFAGTWKARLQELQEHWVDGMAFFHSHRICVFVCTIFSRFLWQRKKRITSATLGGLCVFIFSFPVPCGGLAIPRGRILQVSVSIRNNGYSIRERFSFVLLSFHNLFPPGSQIAFGLVLGERVRKSRSLPPGSSSCGHCHSFLARAGVNVQVKTCRGGWGIPLSPIGNASGRN